MSIVTYTLMNMLIRIRTRVTCRVILMPMKVNTEPMSTTTLIITEGHMSMFNKANSEVGKGFAEGYT